MYEYRATITEAHDGDTVHADIDLGFGITIHDVILRLDGLNAPELVSIAKGGVALHDAGVASRDWLRARVLGKVVTIKTRKDALDKYGRLLVTITDAQGVVNADSIKAGMSVPYDGGAR